MVTRQEWSDAFNNQVANRTNVLDLPSHYRFSPERWTFTKNGTRQFIQYNSVAEYNHATDVHELSPSGGDTVTLESAERPRYVVAFELATTWAFAVNQSLTGNDTLRVGLYDGTDGWYLEQQGDKHTDSQADIVTERAGSVVNREENVDIVKPTTTFARLRLRTAWYNITRQQWERSYSDNKSQANREILITGLDDSRGPEVGNLPLHYELQADASTSGLTLEAGSCAQVNLGTTTQLKRGKTVVHTDTVDTTGSWIPIRAYRIDPDLDIVNVQVRDIDIGQYSVSDDVEILCIAADKSKVKDSGGNDLVDADFSTPNDFNDQNNALQTTTAVEQFPDSSGTVTTSASDPGGWQLARGELYSGSGNSVSGSTGVAKDVKRPLYSRDYMVVLAKSASTGDVDYQLEFEQDW